MKLTDPNSASLLDLTRCLRADFQWGSATSARADRRRRRARRQGAVDLGPLLRGTRAHRRRFQHRCGLRPLPPLPGRRGLMKWLGLDAYRFSIAWPRVQPLGEGAWNEAGLAFYDRLLDALLEAGIRRTPRSTTGTCRSRFTNGSAAGPRAEIVPRFADYAREVARRFGDRLGSIATLNEPWCIATLGYETGQFAPGQTNRTIATQVSHHLLMAHGAAIQAMRSVTKTPLGVVLNHTPAFPAEPLEADRHAARIDDGAERALVHGPDLPRQLSFRHSRIPRRRRAEDRCGGHGPDSPTAGFPRASISTRAASSARSEPPKSAPGNQGFTDMGWEIYPEGLTAAPGAHQPRVLAAADLHHRERHGQSRPGRGWQGARHRSASPTCASTSRRWRGPSTWAWTCAATSTGACSTTSSGTRATPSASACSTWTTRARSAWPRTAPSGTGTSSPNSARAAGPCRRL